MKKLILSLLLVSTFIFGDSITQEQIKVQEQCQQDVKIQDVKQSGCCSWHGGVDGCSGGRIVCNDGTYSPSCTCAVSTPLG